MRKNTSPAKITRPKLPDIFPRKRLFTVLDSNRKKPMTWITGPAGSGKTTLVASYLDARRLPCLWYQMNAGDSDIATFFYYLGLAAQKAAPRYRKPLPVLTPEYLQGISTFTHRFFENLYARLKPPFAIVLDNYQDVPADSRIHDIVNHAVSHVLDGIRVFVLSRNETPPAFARLHANSAVQTVDWNELRFTLEESKRVARLFVHRTLTEDTLAEFHSRTEGWAAGLVLMMERAGSKTQGLPPACKGEQKEVFDYFAGEVFDKLDVETRDFLLMTALLPTITMRTAEKMTDQGNAGRILSALNRNNFFTERHHTVEPSYQYHALFREFLLTRMKESLSGEGLLRVQNRAAAILEETGQVEDAASIYLEAQNWDRYIPLLLAHAQVLIMQGRSATLSEWLAAVPKETRDTVAWLQYWTGACTLLLNPVESQPYFEHAFELFKKGDDVTGQFLAWSGIVDSIFFAGFDYTLLDSWIDELDELLKRHPDFPSMEIEVLVSNSIFSALLYRQTSQAKLVFWQERAARLLPAIADNRLRITLGAHLLNYYIWVGDMAKASQLVDTLRSNDFCHFAHPLALLLFYCLEAVYYWGITDEFERCNETVAQALDMAETTGVHLLDNFLITQGISVALSGGDVSRGAQLLGQIKPILGFARRFDVAHYHYHAAWEATLRDDHPRALEHLLSSLSMTEAAGLPFPQAYNHIALAFLFIILKNFPEASQRIVMAQRINYDIKSPLLETMSLLPEAWLALEQNDEKKCLALLSAAFALGKEKGFVNFPWWLPSVMARLCAKALEAGIEVEYVKGLIRKRNLQPEASLLAGESWPWPMKIYTLGRFELARDGELMQFTGKVQQKPLALLKALIAFGGNDVAEEHIINLLWPDVDGDLAHKSFEMTVQRLRRLLNSNKVIQLQNRCLSLEKSLCWIDAWELETLIERVDGVWKNGQPPRDIPAEAVRLSEKAISVYKGHFLPADSASVCILSFRERLHSKYLRLILKLGAHRELNLQWEKAAEVFQKGLEVDGLAEEFYQHLMVCYQQLGRRAEAVAVYNRCRTLLVSSIAMPPSQKTEDLYQSIIIKKKNLRRWNDKVRN